MPTTNSGPKLARQLQPHREGIPPTPTPPCESSTTAGISYTEPPEVRTAWEVVSLILIFAVAALIAVGLIARVVAM
ncbi:DUF6480 family protein [Streptomyces sp. NPDC088354]|uniref:DUF6480 family protein n=1 Tax=unclassified Streptomyces TaxID=2593676 RepID=UPI0029AC3569|nr:DUF6480 family protein [Streptomyces sp. MI02-7b]MDX3072800.1 DUF6480 family protein [Streptomyces sp. MI02-7b]